MHLLVPSTHLDSENIPEIGRIKSSRFGKRYPHAVVCGFDLEDNTRK